MRRQSFVYRPLQRTDDELKLNHIRCSDGKPHSMLHTAPDKEETLIEIRYRLGGSRSKTCLCNREPSATSQRCFPHICKGNDIFVARVWGFVLTDVL